MKPETTIFLVGDFERPEFREAVAAMHAQCRVVCAATAAEAGNLLTGEAALPELIVMAQVRPAEHDPDDLQRLRRRAPLSSVVLLLGPWSEGEMRSGEPLAGVVRVHWHHWLTRFERQVQWIAKGVCSSWALPPTATDEERLLWSECKGSDSERNRPPREGLVAIVTERSEAAEWLADACAALGQPATRAGLNSWSGPQAAAVIWDMAAGDGGAFELAALAERFGKAPIVALSGFPRPADRERLLAAGAAAVLSKPLALDDLDWELDRLLAKARRESKERRTTET
jgi:CheY-like chemotaxis protein